MSDIQSPIEKYPLLPFSQLVYDMTRWIPSVYRFPMRFLWLGGAKEKKRIIQAIEKAMQNHPVFFMRVDRSGMHYADYNMDTLHGPYMQVEIEENGNDIVVKMCFSRILGDGKSGQILLEDIQRAYAGLPLEPDDYWGYVARYELRKLEPHYTASRDWLVREYEERNFPVRPTIDRRWLMTLLPPKAGLYVENYSSCQKDIQRIMTDYHLNLDGIFSLAAALAIAKYCGTDEAALTWAYEGRELPEEQRIFGSLHRDVPFRIQKSKIENRESAIREARNQIRQGIAHSDFPYTLTAPYTQRWNYAVNVLHMTDVEDFLPSIGIPLRLEPTYKQKYAYALLDIEIVEHAESLQVRYRYSATHYKPESIQKFAALVRKYVKWLID